jgi:dTDP-4-amino-4,6-dideoxygalactose transaminase
MSNPPALLNNTPLFKSKIPITKPSLPEYSNLADQTREIIQTGVLTKGCHVRDFEERVAEHLGVKHAIAVSSCTSGLMLTYQAVGLEGDVVVPSFTFMATVSALRWAGLRPVFADVKRDTMNVDPRSVEEAITPATSAIVAVHNSGNPADIADLQALAGKYHLRLIFDAAHGFGSLYDGKPVGPHGDVQVFSLSPTKLLIAGEGGVVATNQDEIAERVRIGREYGNRGDYDSDFAGLNARMPEFNALLGQHSLRLLESAARRRNEIAELYRERLGRLPGVTFQEVRAGNRSSYKDFAIVIDRQRFGLSRDDLATALDAEMIETRKYHDPPVHRQAAYRCYAPCDRTLGNTEFLAAGILDLPIWSDMDISIATGICVAIERTHECAATIKRLIEQAV